jgi:two-component system sensor histidine kinase BaeS
MALHNLRTPLAVIRGSLDVLRDREDVITAEQRSRLLGAALRGVARIDAMAEEGLLGRPEEEVAPELSAVDPSELLAALARDLADVAAAKDATIEVADEVGASLTIDAALARNALENLVTNAIKHAPEGTTVSVTCRLEGDSVRFDVTDHGPGIDPADHPQVLAGLHRGRPASPTGAPGAPGAGVGLGIVRRLVETGGGRLGLASQLGHGATFWITLPVA